MKPAVSRWLELAEIDLKAARVLLKEGDLTGVVCFHAQQSVEKCLKALIESKGLNPPKSHDLILLNNRVDDQVQLDEDTLSKLNQVYIDTRYPASVGLLPDGLPDLEDAKAFYDYAREVYNQVKAILR
jgi:HEPN domain-containing protein